MAYFCGPAHSNSCQSSSKSKTFVRKTRNSLLVCTFPSLSQGAAVEVITTSPRLFKLCYRSCGLQTVMYTQPFLFRFLFPCHKDKVDHSTVVNLSMKLHFFKTFFPSEYKKLPLGYRQDIHHMDKSIGQPDHLH